MGKLDGLARSGYRDDARLDVAGRFQHHLPAVSSQACRWAGPIAEMMYSWVECSFF